MTDGAPERSLEQELRELRAINELIRTLTSTLELEEILRIVLDRLKSLTQAEALSLMLYDPERDELVFAATETLRENAVVGQRVPPSQSVASWVARCGESAIVNDVRSDPCFSAEIERLARFETRSLLRQVRLIQATAIFSRRHRGRYTWHERTTSESVSCAATAPRSPRCLAIWRNAHPLTIPRHEPSPWFT